jgi:hypothetical protein
MAANAGGRGGHGGFGGHGFSGMHGGRLSGGFPGHMNGMGRPPGGMHMESRPAFRPASPPAAMPGRQGNVAGPGSFHRPNVLWQQSPPPQGRPPLAGNPMRPPPLAGNPMQPPHASMGPGMPMRPPGAMPAPRPPMAGWRPGGGGWHPGAPGWRPPAPAWRPPVAAWRPPAPHWRPRPWHRPHSYGYLYWGMPLYAWGWANGGCSAFWPGDGWLWPWQSPAQADCLYGPEGAFSFGFAW